MSLVPVAAKAGYIIREAHSALAAAGIEGID